VIEKKINEFYTPGTYYVASVEQLVDSKFLLSCAKSSLQTSLDQGAFLAKFSADQSFFITKQDKDSLPSFLFLRDIQGSDTGCNQPAFISIINPQSLIKVYRSTTPSIFSDSYIHETVQIGSCCTIHNSVILNNTVIGDGCLISDSVIGWDCIIENHCHIRNGSCIAKDTKVGKRSSLHNVQILPHKSINPDSTIISHIVL
jgi:hypothetical protein